MAIFKLAVQDKIPSLERYYEVSGKCSVRATGSELNFRKLRLFFGLAYGMCFIQLVHMVLDRQKEAVNNASSGDNSDGI